MKKIAILTWWPGYEREVALRSSKFFETYISRDFETFVLPEELEKFLEKKDTFEKIIPVFHGEYGEDGKIQALLDIYDIPYVGSRYFTHALCMNKSASNCVAKSAGLNVPREITVPADWDFSVSDFSLSFPVIVKPNSGGSSYYTYKVSDMGDLEKKIQEIQEHIDDDILIQEYITWDEYSVSVVNGEILPIMMLEKKNKDDFFDYESKYETESGMKEVFWVEDEDTRNKLLEATKVAQKLFNVEGYFRVDFIVRDGVPYFLEVNTIPGTTEASILPKAWKLTGRSFEELVEHILEYTPSA